MLYFSEMMGCLFPSRLFPNREKFEYLYNDGVGRIEEALDITKMIKKLTTHDILLENSLLTDKAKFLIQHNA